MADANIDVTFSASIGDLVAGVAQVKDSLASLSAPIDAMKARYEDLGGAISRALAPGQFQAFSQALIASASLQNSLAAAHAQASAALRAGDDASYADAVRAARLAVGEEIRALEDGLKQKLSLLDEEAKRHEITAQKKLADSLKALDEEYQGELVLLQRELTLGDLSLAQKQQINNKILDAERRHQDEMNGLVQRSIDQQQRDYESFGASITQGFNSQLRGLIAGTTSWRDAFKSVLSDLLIRFIEWGETDVIRHLANEAAKTAATASGVAARTGAEQSGAAVSFATQAAAMIRSILGSAAETFAGAFGFLSPLLGPAAVGPALAAQASVAGVAGAVASADIGMWRVPGDMLSLVHHNELIMPAAEAGAFRDLLSGGAASGSGGPNVAIHPTTNFHVSAIDSGSIAQWMKANSPAMMKAMNEAVQQGAHLGLRRLAGV